MNGLGVQRRLCELSPATRVISSQAKKPGAAAREIDAVVKRDSGNWAASSSDARCHANSHWYHWQLGPVDGRRFENLAGVAEVIRVTKPYKLITLDLRARKRQLCELGMPPSEEVN